MTIDELRSYIPNKLKIIAIDAEIEASYMTVSSPVPSPVVAGKSNVRPAGDPTASAFSRAEELRQQKAHLIHRQERIEQWVDSITDLTVSAIIQLHFLSGRTWKQTAVQLYGYRYADGDACRMAVKRYLEKESCSVCSEENNYH